MKKTEWYPTICAPAGLPVKVISGSITTSDGYELSLPSGENVSNGWGLTGTVRIEGDEEKTAPRKLSITWFSFADDAFYEASADLPLDAISNMMEKGYKSPLDNSVKSFDFLNIGLAPGGFVSVWLAGEQVSIEVAHFAARKAKLDWSEVLMSETVSREDYINQILEFFKTDTGGNDTDLSNISPDEWHQLYRRGYNWRCEVYGSANPESMLIAYHNGEREFIDFIEEITPPQITNRTAPASIILYWNDGATSFTSDVKLNRDEVLNTLEQLASVSPASPLILQLLLDNTTNELKIAFANNEFIVPQEKAIIKLRNR